MPPNILLLVLDCVRFDGLHCNGNPRPVTPNLDALAAQSRHYTQARAAAVWTLESHASLFTGLHPRQHGVNVETRWLDASIPTMAERLQQVGYETAAFSTNAWVGPHFGLDRGFEHFSSLWRIFPGMGKAPFPFWEKALRKRLLERHDKGAAKLNRHVQRWWRRRRHSDRPFFLFGLYLDAHLPYRPPPGYGERLLDAPALDAARAANQDAWAYMAGETAMTEADFSGLRALYDAEISYVDEQVGELLAFLRSVGALDNTVIIVTADHGENIGDHGLMDHQYCVYDTLARVPLLIRHSDFAPGSDDAPIQHTDLLPMLLDLVEDNPPSPIPHPPSIIQYTAPHRHRFARRHPDFDPAARGFERTFDAIVQDGYKLIRSSRGDLELFDLTVDPAETTDLAHSNFDLTSALSDSLDRWLDTHPAAAADPAPALDPDLADHLRGLGYL